MNHENHNFSSISKKKLSDIYRQAKIRSLAEHEYNAYIASINSGETDVEDIIGKLCYDKQEALADIEKNKYRINQMQEDLDFLKADNVLNLQQLQDLEHYINFLESEEQKGKNRQKVELPKF